MLPICLYGNNIKIVYTLFINVLEKHKNRSFEMAEQDAKITNVKLEINGALYETDHLSSDDCGCNECQLQEYCGAHDELYKFCTHLDWNIYFKKYENKTLEDSRFIHG